MSNDNIKTQVKRKTLIYLLLMLFLSGCIRNDKDKATNYYKITYNTEPIGASVICNGTNEGYSPVTLNYSPNEDHKKMGYIKAASCTATWISGVKKDFTNTWDLNKFPDGVMETLQRPSGDGYSQDVEFALKVQQMKNQQAYYLNQMALQSYAARTQTLRDLNRSLKQSQDSLINSIKEKGNSR